MTRRERAAEVSRRYRRMVAAVRSWAELARPDADKLTLIEEDSMGGGDTIAAFHASGSEWSRGDRLAMPDHTTRGR